MKHTLRLPSIALCLLLLAAGPGHTGDPPDPSTADTLTASIPPGEELLYEVSWWIIRLGTIRLRVVGVADDGAGVRTSVRADIDSYSNLPIASLHSMSESVMDGGWNSVSSLALTEDGESWRSVRYGRARGTERLCVERGSAPGRESGRITVDAVDTLDGIGAFQDGLSIFYFARARLFDSGEVAVPTIVEGRRGRTVFHFPGERTSAEIEALDYPIDVIDFEGVAEFSGLYGLNGDFEGWFTNDEARIPVRANLGLMIGSVKVELIEWKRAGWAPPRSHGD